MKNLFYNKIWKYTACRILIASIIAGIVILCYTNYPIPTLSGLAITIIIFFLIVYLKYKNIIGSSKQPNSRLCYLEFCWFKNLWKLIVSVGVIIGITSGIITICEYSSKNEYQIIYNLKGGNGAINSIYTQRSDTIFLPIESMNKEGYIFAGWYNNDSIQGNPITYIPKGSKGKREFWAKWTPIKYAVKFNTMGGTTINDTTYTIESEDYILPTAITKKDHSFKGWTLGKGEINQIPKGSTGDKEFMALWEKKKVRESPPKDPGGKIEEDTIVPPATTIPTTITVTGYAKEKFSKEEAKRAAFENAISQLKEKYFPKVDITKIRRCAIPGKAKPDRPHPSSDTWDATIEVTISNNIDKLD